MTSYKHQRYQNNDFFYLEFGDKNKPVLLCLHGYADKAELFKQFGRSISHKYRVIALDFPSTRDYSTHSIEDLTKHLHLFTTKLKLSKFSLLGFSLGGFIAINYSSLYPKKIKHLYLLNSTPQFLFKPLINQLFKLLKYLSITSKKFCQLVGFLDTLKPIRIIFRLPKKNKKELNFIRNHAHSLYSTATNVIDHKLTKEFNNLNIPKTVILFKDDKAFKYKKYYQFFKSLKCKIISFNHGGHESNPGYWSNVVSVFSKPKKQKCTCIIPVFNEGKRLINTLNQVVKISNITKIICVDDGSNDEAVKKAKQKFPQIKTITHSENQGKTAAILTGLKKVSTDLVVLLDADLINLNPIEIKNGIEVMINHQYIDMIIFKRKPLFNLASVYTGERVLKTKLLKLSLNQGPKPHHFQIEPAINQYCIDHKKIVFKISISAGHTFEVIKKGLIKGILRDLKTIYEIVKYIGFRKYFYQIFVFGRKKYYL